VLWNRCQSLLVQHECSPELAGNFFLEQGFPFNFMHPGSETLINPLQRNNTHSLAENMHSCCLQHWLGLTALTRKVVTPRANISSVCCSYLNGFRHPLRISRLLARARKQDSVALSWLWREWSQSRNNISQLCYDNSQYWFLFQAPKLRQPMVDASLVDGKANTYLLVHSYLEDKQATKRCWTRPSLVFSLLAI